MSKQPIIEIVWLDAFGRSSWHQKNEHADEYLVQTVGYLLWEDKNYIGTGSNIVPEEDSVSNTTHIPKKTIVSIKMVRGKRRKK